MASEKRCLYEVLGLRKDCSPDEIRSAYKRLALQRHPDKLVQSGLSQAEATAQFQELAHAYEVLSDPKERAWYDSHRSQILFSDFNPSSNSVPNSVIPNLFSFFSNTVFSGYSDSGKGFYKVYSDLFNKIYLNEINFVKKLGLRLDSVREAPIMGNLDSPYGQVTAFYNYWLGFCTVMDFCWVDEYDVTAGPNRKSRRLMEEENKKLRKKARREYNETVRGLAEFVKKRDKRVIDMAVKKNAELEKKKEEERKRRRKMEKERMEKAMAYQEPDWAKVDEEDEALEEAEEDSGKKRNEGKELYCVVCGKKFKSDKQWKNHEQSKKHREKVAELRESFADEEEQREEEEEMDVFEELSGDVEKVEERLREDLEIGDTDEDHGDQNHQVDQQSDEKEGFFDAEEGDEDDEMSVLEAMLSGHKSRKQTMASRPEAEVLQTRVPLENERNEAEFMEYDNRKSTRSQRGDKKDRGNKNGGTMKADLGETKDLNEDIFANSDPQIEESTSHAFLEKEGNEKRDDQSRRNHKAPSGSLDKKGAAKKDINAKSKNASKGKKVKATAKHSGNVCDRCGEEFESRNKLHKHLDDTGHATMKYR